MPTHTTLTQRKCYPREWWLVGRVRVALKNADGSLINPDIPNRTRCRKDGVPHVHIMHPTQVLHMHRARVVRKDCRACTPAPWAQQKGAGMSCVCAHSTSHTCAHYYACIPTPGCSCSSQGSNRESVWWGDHKQEYRWVKQKEKGQEMKAVYHTNTLCKLNPQQHRVLSPRRSAAWQNTTPPRRWFRLVRNSVWFTQ